MLRRVAAQASTHCRRLLAAPSSSSPAIYSQLRQCSSSASSASSSSSHSQTPDSNFVRHSEDSAPTPSSSAKISIDRSGLYNPLEHSHATTSDSELVKHLKGIIKFWGGLITVVEYMVEVLTNPKAGFYINRDVFGAQGDFITSPEVSQMFGEMIGVWVMCVWEQMGRPEKVNLVELGPGRGMLLSHGGRQEKLYLV